MDAQLSMKPNKLVINVSHLNRKICNGPLTCLNNYISKKLAVVLILQKQPGLHSNI